MSEERPKIYPGTPETPRELALGQWWAEQELKSPANLEAAARQIITLVTSLLGLLLAILAVAEDPLPAYLASGGLRLAGGLAILALLGGLEERIQHRPPPGSRLAPRLPLDLQRMPREMPTLTLDAMFNGPERRPFGRDAWLHFQQAQGVRQSWPNND